jgi:drug/metabolite transporter (DMT)-like permease
MAGSAVLFATMNFFVRKASAEVPWQLVGVSRALIGGLVAIGIARLRGTSLAIKDKRAMWLRSAFGTAAMICTFWALGGVELGLGDTTTLFYLSPVMIAILAPLLIGERAGRTLPFALLLSLVGLILVVRPAFVFGGAALTPGAAKVATIAVMAASFSACAMIALRRVGPGESAEAVSMHFSLTAAVVLALMSLPHLMVPSAKDALYTLLAGVSAGLAQLAMTRAYALARAARVAAVGYLAVVVSAAYGAAALGEVPRGTTLLGMALVIAGGLSVTLPALRRRS